MIRRGHKGDEEQNEVRVTDRRRIYLDSDNTERTNEEAEPPNLKPSYVENLTKSGTTDMPSIEPKE
jgi:hypothetical protein